MVPAAVPALLRSRPDLRRQAGRTGVSGGPPQVDEGTEDSRTRSTGEAASARSLVREVRVYNTKLWGSRTLRRTYVVDWGPLYRVDDGVRPVVLYA